ncbi:MAG: trypsin-like peptidase domain-containing protein [Dehalococcoidales bacterium]|nr:trypsin-like peptidase domain-containing protein [Dehalococcoidales bacterium]
MKKLSVKSLLVSILLALILSVSSACGFIEVLPAEPTTTAPVTTPAAKPAPTTPVTPLNPGWTPPSMSSQATQLPSIADVVALVKPSVVAINTEVVTVDFFNRPFSQKGAGSGWIIDKNGLIVTNNHVVEGAKTITVTLDDGRTVDVDITKIYTDALNDLAVLKIEAQNLTALKVGSSAKMRVGEWVVAIGNALGQGIRATEGIVSRKGVSLSESQGQTLFDLIETSAAINPGNSGGPLVNMAGEVIGITSAKIAEVGVEGMGYAISTETAVPIIQELVNNGYVIRPWLGVGLYEVNEFIALRYRLPVNQGIMITEVVKGGPAEKAGLKVNDVIVAMDGKDIISLDDFTKTLHAAQIGQKISVTYYRGTAKTTVEATLTENPRPQ